MTSVEARVLDDGTTQARQPTVNSHDRVLERIDPLGRRTSDTHAGDGVDPAAGATTLSRFDYTYDAVARRLGCGRETPGILKPAGLSPAEPLLLATTSFLPVLEPRQWLTIIGWWEVAIGLAFLFRPTSRIAIALLALQMADTFLPLFLLPGVTFQAGRLLYAPTLEGQYIVKNLLIISAAIVVGSTVRRSSETLPARDRADPSRPAVDCARARAIARSRRPVRHASEQ